MKVATADLTDKKNRRVEGGSLNSEKIQVVA